MSKTPLELRNPIDNFSIWMADFIFPLFRYFNFTANTLTSISFILGLFAIYSYQRNDYIKSAVYFMMSFLFDVFDGHYARKYNMVSNFGDMYDHFTDVIIFILMGWMIYKKYSKLKDWKRYLPYGYIVLIILSLCGMGCQETYHNKNINDGNQFLLTTRYLCPGNTKEEIVNSLKMLKFCGVGPTYLYMSILVLYSGKIDGELK